MKHDTNTGKLTLKQYVNAKRRAKQEELKNYEQKYLARYKQPKSSAGKSKSWTQSDVNLGKISLQPYINAKRRAKQEELKNYEQKYLARYKQPKSSEGKSSNLGHNMMLDLGKIALQPYINAKRRAKQEELKNYEQKYLARYKQPKSSAGKSKSWTQSDVNLGKISLQPYINAKRRAKQEELKNYEQKYLARYKQPKSSAGKSSNLGHNLILNLGKISLQPYINAKRRAKQEELKNYEQKYLARYKQPKSGVKPSNLKYDTDVR